MIDSSLKHDGPLFQKLQSWNPTLREMASNRNVYTCQNRHAFENSEHNHIDVLGRACTHVKTDILLNILSTTTI